MDEDMRPGMKKPEPNSALVEDVTQAGEEDFPAKQTIQNFQLAGKPPHRMRQYFCFRRPSFNDSLRRILVMENIEKSCTRVVAQHAVYAPERRFLLLVLFARSNVQGLVHDRGQIVDGCVVVFVLGDVVE